MNKHHPEDQAVSLKGDSMNAPHSQDQTVFPAGVEPLIQLWLLRLLVPLGAFKNGFGRDSFDEELLASLAQIFAVDIESCITQDEHGNRKLNCEKALRRFDELHANAEKSLKHATPPECVVKMTQCMSELLGGLSATDCRLLEFSRLWSNVKVLQQTGNLLGGLKKEQLFQPLSVILDLPLEEVRDALSKNGALYRLGFRLPRRNCNLVKPKLGKLRKLLLGIRLTRVVPVALSNFPKFLGFEDWKDLFRSEALPDDKSMERKLNTLKSPIEEWERWKATQEEECGLKMREDLKRFQESYYLKFVYCCCTVWFFLKNIGAIIDVLKDKKSD